MSKKSAKAKRDAAIAEWSTAKMLAYEHGRFNDIETIKIRFRMNTFNRVSADRLSAAAAALRKLVAPTSQEGE